MLDQIFGVSFMVLVMALAISFAKAKKRKYTLVIVGAFLSLIAALTLLPPVHAPSGSNVQSDGWGNWVSILISYSNYGGSVNIKAHALWIGGTILGMTIGCPIFYGESMIAIVLGYSGGNQVYFRFYIHSRGWQFDKSWTYYLPSGLDAVTVYTGTTFFSIPFGESTIFCACYA